MRSSERLEEGIYNEEDLAYLSDKWELASLLESVKRRMVSTTGVFTVDLRNLRWRVRELGVSASSDCQAEDLLA